MACYLTAARRALLRAFQADWRIQNRVSTWREFGPGLRERLLIDHTHCPMLAVYPLTIPLDEVYNMGRDVDQDLMILAATSSQNARPTEELFVAILNRLDVSTWTGLGLTPRGLKKFTLTDVRWIANVEESGDHLIWELRMTVRVQWIQKRLTDEGGLPTSTTAVPATTTTTA